MITIKIIAFVIAWQVAGLILIALGKCMRTEGVLRHTRGWEFVNPAYVYTYNKVNYFGAVVVALGYTCLCPAGALSYWFYKACTVGREKVDGTFVKK